MVAKWRLSGSLLGECNCDWGCPCSFDAPPTNGGCEGVYTWIVDKGVYGNVKLDGLVFAPSLGLGRAPSTSATGRPSWSWTGEQSPSSAKPW